MRRLWGSEIKKKKKKNHVLHFVVALLFTRVFYNAACCQWSNEVFSAKEIIFSFQFFFQRKESKQEKKKDKLFQSNILKISCAMQSSYFSIPIHGDFYNLSGRPSGPPTSSSH